MAVLKSKTQIVLEAIVDMIAIVALVLLTLFRSDMPIVLSVSLIGLLAGVRLTDILGGKGNPPTGGVTGLIVALGSAVAARGVSGHA